MVDQEASGDLEAQLQRLGLTRYQARAYLALWLGGPMMASEVAARADVPRTRIYEICRDLAERGLVAEVAGSGRRFQARPLRNLIEHERTRLTADLQQMEARHHEVVSVLERARNVEQAPAEEGGLAIIRGPQRVRGHVASMLTRASREVEVLLGSREAGRLRAYLEEVPKEVRVRVVLRVDEETRPAQHACERSGWECRDSLRDRPVTSIVVDGRETIMLLPMEAGGPPGMALWADHPRVVESRAIEFEEAWAASRPPRVGPDLDQPPSQS